MAWACKNNYAISTFYHHSLISLGADLETAKSHNQSWISSEKSGFPVVLSIANTELSTLRVLLAKSLWRGKMKTVFGPIFIKAKEKAGRKVRCKTATKNFANPKVFLEHTCTNQNLWKQRHTNNFRYISPASLTTELFSLLQTDSYLFWSALNQPDGNQLWSNSYQ